jgi:hypothetical protein
MCNRVASVDALTFLEISVSAVWILLVLLLFVSLVSLPHTHARTHTHIHIHAHTPTYRYTRARAHTHTYTRAHTHTHTRAHTHTHTHTFLKCQLFVCKYPVYRPALIICFKLKLSLCSKVYFHLINNSDVTNVIIIITMNRINWYFNFNKLYFFCTLLPDILKELLAFEFQASLFCLFGNSGIQLSVYIEHWWIDTDRVKGRTRRNTCSGATLSTTNFLCTGQELNPRLGDQSPAATELSHENPRPVKTVRVSYRCQLFWVLWGRMRSVFLLQQEIIVVSSRR